MRLVRDTLSILSPRLSRAYPAARTPALDGQCRLAELARAHLMLA